MKQRSLLAGRFQARRARRRLRAFRARIDRWIREIGARHAYQPGLLCWRELPGDCLCMEDRFHPGVCVPALRWDADGGTFVSVKASAQRPLDDRAGWLARGGRSEPVDPLAEMDAAERRQEARMAAAIAADDDAWRFAE